MSLKKAVIIVAGGSGTRMLQDIPKQFLSLGNQCVLMHTMDVFCQFDPEAQIILVLSQAHLNIWTELCEKYHYGVPHAITYGGQTRFHSVQNGLKMLNQDIDLVAIHDAVRPFVSQEVVRSAFEQARVKGTAIPVVPVVDSLRRITAMSSSDQNVFEKSYTGINTSVSRSEYVQVQTPQVFRREIIEDAYDQLYSVEFTDDASVVEKRGYSICLILGNRENIKLTTPWDMQIAKTII